MGISAFSRFNGIAIGGRQQKKPLMERLAGKPNSPLNGSANGAVNNGDVNNGAINNGTQKAANAPSPYERVAQGFADRKAQLAELFSLEKLIPPSRHQPKKLVHQLASPWNSTIDSFVERQSGPPSVRANRARMERELTREEWQTYFRYLRHYWKPYWPLGIASGALLMGMGVYGMIYAATLKIVLDKVLAAKGGAVIIPILIKLLALLPLAFAITMLGDWLAGRLSARISNDVRSDLFSHLQNHSIDYYKQNKLGDILAHFAGDIPNAERGMGRVLLRISSSTATILLTLALLIWIEWHLALYLFVILPTAVILFQKNAPDATGAMRAQRNFDGLTVSMLEESLRAQPIVQSFGLRQFMQDSYSAALQQLEKLGTRSSLQMGLLLRGSDASSILVDVSTISLGVVLIMWGVTSITSLIAFQALLTTIRRDFTNTINDSQLLINAVASTGRIDRLFQQKSALLDRVDAVELPPFHREICLENVTFSYNGHEQQIQEMDLTIPAGSFVAFVGPSGAGKSTILNLLLRFYDVTAGRVTIDGYDVREVTQSSLRANMAVVLQETFLFHTTIFDNIRIVKPEASEEEVIAAAQAAELHDFVMSLPDGYQSNVGEGGGKLSGGQKQRVAIARAMLADPDILLLDEATSSLDADTAAAINQTIQKIAQTRTVIAITHHLSAVVNADTIYVLQGGRLVEQGSHQSLVEQDGVYSQLWSTQNQISG